MTLKKYFSAGISSTAGYVAWGIAAAAAYAYYSTRSTPTVMSASEIEIFNKMRKKETAHLVKKPRQEA
jgi:hypothetical protein